MCLRTTNSLHKRSTGMRKQQSRLHSVYCMYTCASGKEVDDNPKGMCQFPVNVDGLLRPDTATPLRQWEFSPLTASLFEHRWRSNTSSRTLATCLSPAWPAWQRCVKAFPRQPHSVQAQKTQQKRTDGGRRSSL